jgi:alginate O-acetyltransferase complex protein AlgI
VSPLELAGFALPLFLARYAPSRSRLGVLLALCFVYYGLAAGGEATALLVGAILITFGAGRAASASRSPGRRRALLLAGVASLLAFLALFKYGAVLSSALRWAAPLGVSYFAFKLLSYLLDLYWDERPAERNPAALALYAVFTPQIVSGPIQRAGDFLGQLRSGVERPPVAAGLRLILFGLFKKLVVADRLALLVDPVYRAPLEATPTAVLFAVYAFAFQLYADFSGLTDIAIGLGRLVGIEAPPNFDAPFLAPNIEEFWRRWHMSLTFWLSDYLFTPLRMSLRAFGAPGLAVAIVINMTAIGVWHGARWTYLFFGVSMGILLAVSALTGRLRRGWERRSPLYSRVAAFAGPVLTFHLMVLGWILFRAPDLRTAGEVLTLLPAGLAGLASSPSAAVASALVSVHLEGTHLALTLFALLAMQLMHLLRHSVARGRFDVVVPAPVRFALYQAALIAVVANGSLEPGLFLYAQF